MFLGENSLQQSVYLSVNLVPRLIQSASERFQIFLFYSQFQIEHQSIFNYGNRKETIHLLKHYLIVL